MYVEHVYCINLERRKDRKRSSENQFKIHGIENVEFFNATDGNVKSPPGIQVTKPEWGCADSHIRIWRDIIEQNYGTVLVFEDDINISENFLEKLWLVMNDLKDTDWDYVNLGPSPYPFRIDGSRETEFVQEGLSLLTHCYLITRKGAEKLAKWNPDDLRCSIDTQIAKTPLKMYYAKDTIVTQEVSGSPLMGLFSSVINGDIGFSRTLPVWFIIESSIVHICLIILLIVFLIKKYGSFKN